MSVLHERERIFGNRIYANHRLMFFVAETYADCISVENPLLSYENVWRPKRIGYIVAKTRSAVPSLDLLALPSKN